MGRGGPPRKPDEIKRREGNPGNRSLNDRLPDYGEADIIEPPGPLGDVGMKLWEQQSGLMINAGVLKKTDVPILYAYCKVADRIAFFDRLLDTIAKKKKLNFFDMKEIHNLQRTATAARSQFRHYAQELGLTPASRSGVQGKKRKTSAEKAKDRGQGQTGGTFAGEGNVTRFFDRRTGTGGTPPPKK